MAISKKKILTGNAEDAATINVQASQRLNIRIDDLKTFQPLTDNQKIFFDAWMIYINPLYNNNSRYKGDYATTIIVNQYNVSGEKTYSINLNEAFPISMNQMDLNWGDDSYHKLSVTFAYTYWQNNSLQALGMELVDAGINAVTSALGGLDGGSSGIVDQTKNGLLSGF